MAISAVTVLFRNEAGGVVGTTFSDSDGSFSKSALTGSVTVEACKKGWEFVPQNWTVHRANPELYFYGHSIP